MDMHYEGAIYRPPSEAYSILIQVTVGCSHNKCTFCGMYKAKRFQIKSDEIIMHDIAYAAKNYQQAKRVFFCDGDALIMPQKKLLKYIKEVKKQMPWVERVGVYSNTKSIDLKSPEELRELKENGLDIAYLGLESGDDVTLKAINKGADSAKMIEMGRKIREAGIKLSITVLNGIAGKERSVIHARETGRVLSEIDPEFVGALSLMYPSEREYQGFPEKAIPPLYNDIKSGRFYLLKAEEMLEELGIMFAATNLTNGRFHANHASNFLDIRAKLPEDKDKTLKLISDALQGKVKLKPEEFRAL